MTTDERNSPSRHPLEEMTFDEYATTTRVLRATIHLTDYCNLECPYCGLDSGKQKLSQIMPMEQVQHVIRVLDDYGVCTLDLTGGEIFTRQDIFEIIDKATRTRAAVGLLTNGTLITEDVARKLSGYFIYSVKISLDGLRHANDSLRGIGSFDKAINAMEFLLKHTKAKVKAMVTLTRRNVGDLGPLARQLASLGVCRMVVRPCIAIGRATRSIVPTDDDLWLAYRSLLLRAHELPEGFVEWSCANPYPHLRIWASSPYTMVEESARHLTIMTNCIVMIDFCKGQSAENVLGNAFSDDLMEMLHEAERRARASFEKCVPLLLEKELDWCPVNLGPTSSDIQTRGCPVCLGSSYIPIGRVILRARGTQEPSREFTLVSCSHDGAMWLQPGLSETAVRRIYQSPAYFGKERDWVDNSHLRSWTQIARFGYGPNYERSARIMAFKRRLGGLVEAEQVRPSDTILDVGCGRGYFLETCREAGWLGEKLFGLEISKVAAKEVQARSLNVVVGDMDAAFPWRNGELDIVSMFDVLEHSLKPLHLLSEARRILARHGRLLIEVPLYDPESLICLRSLEHAVYFTEECIRHVLAQAGFNISSWQQETVRYACDLSVQRALIVAGKEGDRV